MRLLSDYSQWYDGLFNDQPPDFHRFAYSRGGLAKSAQFQLFHSLGLKTPPFGRVLLLSQNLSNPVTGLAAPPCLSADIQCVVYLDEYAHSGHGKILMPLSEALEKHPDCFASLYVPTTLRPVILRLARFGQWAFWLRQQGCSGQWRSNLQDSEVVLGKAHCATPNPIPRVVWAIDFVPSAFGLLAVDFNTAPELSTLGEMGVLNTSEIEQELLRVAASCPEHLRQF